MPINPVTPHAVYRYPNPIPRDGPRHRWEEGSNVTNNIRPKVHAFVDQRELAVVREALKAMREAIALKRELHLPVLPETRAAIESLEYEVGTLKLEMLRCHHPDQLSLDGMDDNDGH